MEIDLKTAGRYNKVVSELRSLQREYINNPSKRSKGLERRMLNLYNEAIGIDQSIVKNNPNCRKGNYEL